MNISLVIPCIPEDHDSLIKVIDAYKNGSIQPNEYIISYSNCSKQDSKKLDDLEAMFSNINLKLLRVDQLLNRAENRNNGAKYAKWDIISFNDADDIPHPQRIEIIKYCFDNYNIDALLHSYLLSECIGKSIDHCTFCRRKSINIFEHYDLNNLSLIHDNIVRQLTFPSSDILPNVKSIIAFNGEKQINIHHGHISIKKKVFDKVKFNRKFIRGQDSLFCQNVLYEGYKVAVVDANLLIYTSNWQPKDDDFFKVNINDKTIIVDIGNRTPPKPALPMTKQEIDIKLETIKKYLESLLS